jgi:hypothetical protein
MVSTALPYYKYLAESVETTRFVIGYTDAQCLHVTDNNQMLVLAIDTRIDSQFRGPGLPRDKEVMPIHEQLLRPPIAFYWKSTISTKLAPPIEIARARGDNFFCVRGDDDFVVLFARHGFVVWCFGKDTRLPVSWSKSDSTVSDEVGNQHQESDLGFMFS